ncbi:hypothetical protein [Moritella viscosa]|uniref:Uncharacterized protein n=1 Tax=Moritella viscosa TaxID=80854 RepID=A0ABY1HI35_9GAMM|nr:hypothetical protein [Moritella viscosa]SGZ00099.1 Putative uncharacterized protein [Moritella viscosa]SGZ16723.1 Putative uncharacterized protein [Moritella viscosa]SHO28151.1 Putative uncharacterized protein [Moritella viscosa]
MRNLDELKCLIEELQTYTNTTDDDKYFRKIGKLNEPKNVATLVNSIFKGVLSHEQPRLMSVDLAEEDINQLINLHVKDMYRFATKNNIHLNGIRSYGQEVFNPSALFHLAKKKLISSSFTNHREAESEGFDFYQIPFILRLAIENKVKTIIGYQTCFSLKNNKECPFPTSKVIKFLIKHEDCFLYENHELINVYQWSCTFVHDAKLDYIWNIVNAVSICNPIFDEMFNQKIRGRIERNVDTNDLDSFLNFLHETQKVNFFNRRLNIKLLQDEVNNHSLFKKNMRFELSLDELESSNVIYSPQHA